LLPKYGDRLNVSYLTISDLERSDSLIALFERIEDVLHQASIDPDKRYEIILQLILTKLFDEHSNEKNHNGRLAIQDFTISETPPSIARQKMDELLEQAVTYYQNYLPRTVPSSFNIRPQTLVDILRLLAPIRLTAAKREVIQTFYMKFAKDLYRWDLAQYFTPINVTDFIIDVLNPQFGEHIKDPACGSADFLTAAFYKCRDKYENYSDCIWGSDNSANAVQIAVLNMLFNGDGKTNVRREDSLETSDQHENQYKIVVCNPPFGNKILEKRKDVLRKFELAYEWAFNEDKALILSNRLLEKQETGILFVEACAEESVLYYQEIAQGNIIS
jgi:type I restriction enzyme M protein